MEDVLQIFTAGCPTLIQSATLDFFNAHNGLLTEKIDWAWLGITLLVSLICKSQ